MSTYESAYKSLLQGVSQQLPEERQPGQVQAQLNMLADPVTNIRRRPGAQVRAAYPMGAADPERILGWFTDIAGKRVHIILDTNTGKVLVLDEGYAVLADLPASGYLAAASAKSIRATTVGSEFFLCNTERRPTAGYSGKFRIDPTRGGFAYIPAGSFGKEYNLTVRVNGASSGTASYTTPSGANPGDAALATPDNIALNLATTLAFNPHRLSIRTLGVSNGLKLQYTANGGASWTDMVVGQAYDAAYFLQGKARVLNPSGTAQPMEMTYHIGQPSTGVEGPPQQYTQIPVPAYGTRVVPLARLLDVPFPGVAGYATEIAGPYIFVLGTVPLTVDTTNGAQYVVTSGGGAVLNSGQLPARLPASADAWSIKVGTGRSPQYYAYDAASSTWLETSAYGSATGYTNCPVTLTRSPAWGIVGGSFEGRFAGDDDSNTPHSWMVNGISGMGTYQGRLVLLSGNMVSLSAAGKAYRFYRSTVTSVIDSDPIEVGSSMNSAAAYEYAVPFQKDLVLFSRGYQAVLPSGNRAITPSTATVVPTSTHEVDTSSAPLPLGRTLMYCAPRSENFFGMLEMVPSQYTDSQYVSQESTPHLPRYMPGRCRFSAASSVANIALFAPTGDLRSLIVHEYHWDGDQKVQQAWHTWTFKFPVAAAYFATDVLVLVFVRNGNLLITTIDPRAGRGAPLVDLAVPVPINGNTGAVPASVTAFDPGMFGAILVHASGPLRGERIGIETFLGGAITTVPSQVTANAVFGYPYQSTLVPSPPVIRDREGSPISTGKATLIRETIGTRDSATFNVTVHDAYSAGAADAAPPLTFSSPELALGSALVSKDSAVVVPCRTDMRSTQLVLDSVEAGEMNITSIEYAGKYQPKIARR